MSDTVLNALQLIKAIHDQPSAGALFRKFNESVREQVLLAPKTLEQLQAAIDVERKRVEAKVEYVTVVVIRNNVVDESFLFVGPHDMVAASAEGKYRELAQKWTNHDEATIDGSLEDGYLEWDNGSLCLTWPNHEACTTTGKRGIKAAITGDGTTVEVEFDAVPWFEQASDDEIEELAGVGWGGDYEADAVAEFVADTQPSVRKVIDAGKGFEVHVNVADALHWLNEHRPSLAQRISE